MSTLEFDQLTKRYGAVMALDGFSAEIQPGSAGGRGVWLSGHGFAGV